MDFDDGADALDELQGLRGCAAPQPETSRPMRIHARQRRTRRVLFEALEGLDEQLVVRIPRDPGHLVEHGHRAAPLLHVPAAVEFVDGRLQELHRIVRPPNRHVHVAEICLDRRQPLVPLSEECQRGLEVLHRSFSVETLGLFGGRPVRVDRRVGERDAATDRMRHHEPRNG